MGMTKIPRVYRFHDHTSAEVYAFCQTSGEVRDGDVLIVPGEAVAGVLIQARPIAVSANPGSFDQTTPGFDWDAVQMGWDEPRNFRKSFELAADAFSRAMGRRTQRLEGCGCCE